MLAICERTSIEIALENGSKFPVYAVVRLFSNIDMFCVIYCNLNPYKPASVLWDKRQTE